MNMSLPDPNRALHVWKKSKDQLKSNKMKFTKNEGSLFFDDVIPSLSLYLLTIRVPVHVT